MGEQKASKDKNLIRKFHGRRSARINYPDHNYGHHSTKKNYYDRCYYYSKNGDYKI